MEQPLPPGRLLGHKQRSYQLPGFLVSEVCYEADLVLRPHCHENAFFCLILQGTGSDISTRGTFLGKAATLVYHPAGESHANRWYEAGRCLIVELSAGSRERLRGHAKALGEGGGFASGPAVQTALQVFREFHHLDAVSPLALEGLILELIAAVCRSAAPPRRSAPPDWLRRVRELLHDRLSEGLSLGQIAAAVGVHPGHVWRMFRRHYRCTPGEYLRRLRVEQACRELARGGKPLAEIALAAGFADQSHLSRAFKRHMGLTPAEYRKSLPTR
jgi:AraC family transcriptional regulator